MTVQRMEHVGIVVDDLAAATAFSVELGLEMQGEDSIVGRAMECANQKVPVHDGSSLRVRDVMLARPKTMDARATVADLRRVFENVHLRNALLVDEGAFAGSIEREQIGAELPDGAPARDLAHRDVPSISPEASAAEARRFMDEAGAFRLVVTGPGGRLEGLLCLDTARTGFCT